MPVDQSTVLNIVCDNPDCPGNDLDPTNRMGWTFVTTEVYGQPVSAQKVYCCPTCAGHVTQVLEEKQAEISAPARPITGDADVPAAPPVDTEVGKVA